MAAVRRRLLVALTTLALALPTSAVAAGPSTQVVSRGVRIPAFYTPPATLPDGNGRLVRTQPLPLALSLPGLSGPLPGTATRIMYTTTDSTGRRVAVTGAYVEPTARWRGSGARPLVVLAPGTMGQGDQCAPSLALERGLVVGQLTLSVSYEDLALYKLLARGVAVVQTDYVGLGATDRLHTYVNRVDGAHAVLDAARAALSLPGTSLTSRSPVGLYGYSEGGGAVAAAAELQVGYAPTLRLLATYAGAPPADLRAVAEAIDGTELAGALAWSVNGFVQAAPALRPVLDRYVSAEGRAVLADLSTRCVGDAIAVYASARSSAWTTNGRSLSQIIAGEPLLRSFVADQLIGRRRPTGAVRIATGVADDLVPHAQARRLAVAWCGLGADVVYAPVVLPALPSPLVNHFGPLLVDQDTAVDWLADGLAGAPARSTCATLPFSP